jgi:hypothetical protein
MNTHTLVINADYLPKLVNVRITHVNPDNTVTVHDAEFPSHVWFGVRRSQLEPI